MQTSIMFVPQIRNKAQRDGKCPNRTTGKSKGPEPVCYLPKPHHHLPGPKRLPSHLPELVHQWSEPLGESPTPPVPGSCNLQKITSSY